LFYKYEGAGESLNLTLILRQPDGQLPGRQKPWTARIVVPGKAMCQEFGFQSIKLKGGVFEPQLEVDAMFALREAFGPDVPLRIDPMHMGGGNSH
jgi:glucarate dehydratase